MIDKDLVKRNFKKYLKDYTGNASVQKQMAEKLVSLLPESKFHDILEIGSYSGILTSELIKHKEFKNYSAIDIIEESEEYMKNINPCIKFFKADIETFDTSSKFDLIISNASLQWCENFEAVIKKIRNYLTPKGIMAISIFSEDNLKEIKEVFGISLNYPSEKELNKIFNSQTIIKKEEIVLNFNSPNEVLKHLKFTGVNSIAKTSYSYKTIKSKLNELNKYWNNSLTYTPVYIVGK